MELRSHCLINLLTDQTTYIFVNGNQMKDSVDLFLTNQLEHLKMELGIIWYVHLMDMVKHLKIKINTSRYYIFQGKLLMISNQAIFKELFYLRKKQYFKF